MDWLIIIGWIICGVLAYGITFTWNQGHWDTLAKDWYGRDMGFSIFVGLFGPIGLIAMFFISEFAKYGLKFK